MDAPTARGIPLSALCPKFLHTNSTSHINPFGAFAELIDNAYDPDVSAKQIWIEKNIFKQQDCLIFMDNGSGMDYQKMHKMLSFGFSDKKKIRGHAPVGLYGNGFKSGSMRLGKDAIVFSKKGDGMCVGLLSQTYLEETKSENIVVPMVTFTCNRNSQTSPEHAASLQDILSHSIFQTEKELLCEFDAISNVSQTSLRTGTRIIIWNLRRTLKEESEFDFTSGRYDIQIPVEADQNSSMTHNGQHGRSVPESSFSLRAYCSILYLKPKMQIIIRGEKVQTKLVSKSLAHTMTDKYKPLFLLGKTIPITFGFNPDNKEHYGLMMYHKNRLIKAYERVGCQNKANTKGVGVIGVIECNFLKPTHNKQDFDYTEEYRKTISSVSSKLEDYWKEVCHKRNIEDPNCSVPVEDIMKHPDQSWVQCDECFKWRKLPDGIDARRLPKNWFCHMNPDPQFRSCKVEEEPEDSDEEACNQKTYKHQEQLVKMQKELNKQEALMKQNDSVVSDAGSPVRQTPPSTPSNRMAKITTPSRTPRAFRQSQRSRTRKKARMSIGYQSNLSEGPSTSSMSELCSSRVQSPNLMMDEEEQSGVEGGDLIGSLLRSQRTARPQSENFDCKEISVVGRGEDGQDYKILYQQATRDMEEMRQERDELKSKLDRLEAEKSSAEGNGGSEALRKEPEKDRSDAERLRELRRSVGTLLVKFVPDLKLDQVNFDTSVIEEILNQVLTDISSDDSKDASCNG